MVFILVHVSAGLYDKQLIAARGRILGLILKVQVINIFIGTAFFYLAPVAIAPKANLIMYFIISTILISVWRIIMAPVFTSGIKQPVILVGSGQDIDSLQDVVTHGQYSFFFARTITPSTVDATVAHISEAVRTTGATTIVMDLYNTTAEAAMPFLYSLMFSGIQIVDAGKLYESIFDRIPLSMVGERWLVENSDMVLGRRVAYDIFKRALDIIIGSLALFVSLVFYPFVYCAIKIEDRGPLFISQERVGKNGKSFKIYKFRSMSGNDQGKYTTAKGTAFTVTRVGAFLRVSRIDELPQLWSVLKGDQSLIGPRPELPNLVSVYAKEIPYYNARHLVMPGLSGWAQIYHQAHPHHAVDTEETRNKLSYDLFYIKNRSFILELKIVLRTIQILLKRLGK